MEKTGLAGLEAWLRFGILFKRRITSEWSSEHLVPKHTVEKLRTSAHS